MKIALKSDKWIQYMHIYHLEVSKSISGACM